MEPDSLVETILQGGRSAAAADTILLPSAARVPSQPRGAPAAGQLDAPARPLRVRPTPARRLALLGGFRLTVAERVVSVPPNTQRLLSLLALRGRCGRSRLAGSLWPETTETRALASLRTAVWRANQASPALVEARRDTVGIANDVEVDVSALIATGHEVLDGDRAVNIDVPGLTLVEGDLLPDWDDEWLIVDRARLRQLRLHVLESLALQLARQGRYGMALDAALAALCADPLRESAHRAVIRIHLAEGNLSEAERAYQQCCSLLAREFGTPPSPQTTQLVAAVTGAAPVGGPPRRP